MNKRKNRTTIIWPHFGKSIEIARLDSRDGFFSFFDSKGEPIIPTHIEIGGGYNRKKGKPKVINQVKTNSTLIDLNPNAALKNFDWLFAIDTNTITYDNSVIAISCSIFAEVNLSAPTTHLGTTNQNWETKVVPQDAFIFRNPKVNPEIVGWEELINRVQQSLKFVYGKKIGIIVDSELKLLGPINRREAPILGNHYLPKDFELLYASSDVGAEYPHNKLLRICDKTSFRILNYISKHPKIISNIEKFQNPFIDGLTTLPSTLVHKLSGYAN